MESLCRRACQCFSLLCGAALVLRRAKVVPEFSAESVLSKLDEDSSRHAAEDTSEALTVEMVTVTFGPVTETN